MDILRVFQNFPAMKESVVGKRPEGFPGQRLVIIPPAIAVEASRQPITRDLCVTHIGYFSAAGGHYVQRPHGTSQYILIACLSGEGICLLEGREFRLKPGDLLFLPPGKKHRYQSKPDAPWTIFWVHFRGLRVHDYLGMLGVTEADPVLGVEEPAALVEAFEDTFRHTLHGFGESAMIGLSTAFARLLGLAHAHRRSAGERSRASEDRMLRALGNMRENLAHPWSLHELAALAALSVPHFTELCRKQTGLPPLGLLIRLRLQTAMELLQRGTHNVSEAAGAVGYEDPFYFSRLFRKHMGIAPSTCRNGP